MPPLRPTSTPGSLLIIALVVSAPHAPGTLVSPAEATAQSLDEQLRERFLEARELFYSLEPERSVPAFTQVIRFLEAQEEGRDLRGDERRMLAESALYRAQARYENGGDEQLVRDDLRLSLTVQPDPSTLDVELDLAPPGFRELILDVQDEVLARLYIMPTPMAAAITIDGRPVLPSLDGVAVSAGTHEIAARHPGYEESCTTLEVEAGAIRTVELALTEQIAVFTKVDFFEMVEDGQEKRDARLEIHMGAETVVIADEDDGAEEALYATIPFAHIQELTYERSKQPRVPVIGGVLSELPVLSLLGGIFTGKAHWLTILFPDLETIPDGFCYLRLDKNNYRQILTALESATGVPVEESIGED